MTDRIKEIIANLPAVSAGSYLRLIALAAAFTVLCLRSAGVEIFPGDEETISTAVTVVFAAASALAAYWKNNSFTSAAIAADEVMKNLKKGMVY